MGLNRGPHHSTYEEHLGDRKMWIVDLVVWLDDSLPNLQSTWGPE